jgi:4-hydroxymandelate oxidase
MDPRRVPATWKDVERLRAFTKLPVILKGILDPEDAEVAIQSGASAVIVSNHGGRNLDTAPASIDALPEVVDRVQSRVPLLVDGGIRRGTDVLKALALGAAAVLIGRPYCYALSVAGGAGVSRVVDILCSEREAAMMLSGISDVRSADRSLLWDP